MVPVTAISSEGASHPSFVLERWWWCVYGFVETPPSKRLPAPFYSFLNFLLSRAISPITRLPANPATYILPLPPYLPQYLPALMISTLATDMKSCARFISAQRNSHISITLNSFRAYNHLFYLYLGIYYIHVGVVGGGLLRC